MDFNLLITLFLIFLLSASATYFLIRSGETIAPLDVPNARSLHVKATPRSGGLAIFLGVVVGVGLSASASLFTPSAAFLIGGVMALVLVSFWDDRKDISPIIRLIIHLLAAFSLLLALPGGWSEGVAVSIPLALLSVWSINLYNFMDGMDGFASAMAIIGFSTLAILGWWSGHVDYTMILLFVVTACSGFLLFNFPPAKIFLGDVGSTLLGYTMAGASLWGIGEGIYYWWVPVIVFAPCWVDATFTLLARLFRGEKVWQALREHWYQQAVLSGYSVRTVLVVEIAVMLVCGAMAVVGSIV